jgi:peptidoglycan hydrolase CwlO-like protein
MTYAYDNSEHAERAEEIQILKASWESLQAEIDSLRERLVALYKEEEMLRKEARALFVVLE